MLCCVCVALPCISCVSYFRGRAWLKHPGWAELPKSSFLHLLMLCWHSHTTASVSLVFPTCFSVITNEIFSWSRLPVVNLSVWSLDFLRCGLLCQTLCCSVVILAIFSEKPFAGRTHIADASSHAVFTSLRFSYPSRAGDVAQLVKFLSSLHDTLSLIPSTECGGAHLQHGHLKGRGRKIIKFRLSLGTQQV